MRQLLVNRVWLLSLRLEKKLCIKATALMGYEVGVEHCS